MPALSCVRRMSFVLPVEGALSQAPVVAHLSLIGSSVVDFRMLPAGPDFLDCCSYLACRVYEYLDLVFPVLPWIVFHKSFCCFQGRHIPGEEFKFYLLDTVHRSLLAKSLIFLSFYEVLFCFLFFFSIRSALISPPVYTQ